MEFPNWTKRKDVAEKAMAKDEGAQQQAAAVGQVATDGAAKPPEVPDAKNKLQKAGALAGAQADDWDSPLDERRPTGYEDVTKAGQYQAADLFSAMPSL